MTGKQRRVNGRKAVMQTAMTVVVIVFGIVFGVVAVMGQDQHMLPGHGTAACKLDSHPTTGSWGGSIPITEQVVMEWEGWRSVAYRLPGESHYTVGYGTLLTKDSQVALSRVSDGRLVVEKLVSGKQILTRQEGMLLLREAIAVKRAAAEKALPQFNTYPERVRAAIVDGFYRGDLSGSPETLRLIRAGRWAEASREFLNNNEYRTASQRGMLGVAKRMEWRSQVFQSYAEGRM